MEEVMVESVDDSGVSSVSSGLANPEAVTAPASSSSSDGVKVTADGGVIKTVLSAGSGNLPPLHARCLVHYVGRLPSTGDIFLDTKTESQSGEPVQLVAGRDSAHREVGLNLAVATMRKGERCRLRVQPQYGYGERGSFSFPNVPPSAELEYDLELVDFEAVDEFKDRGQMTYEERLEAAERHRLKGNALFQQARSPGEATEALGKYAMAVSYINEDFLVQLEGPHADRAYALRLPIHLNMAACQIRLQDWQGAAWNCTQVLAQDKDNTKALFRRGRARLALGATEDALRDLMAAAALAPEERAVAREVAAAKANMRRDREAQAKMFKGAFEARQEKGLWSDSAADVQLLRSGALGWLWGLLMGWVSFLFGVKSVRR